LKRACSTLMRAGMPALPAKGACSRRGARGSRSLRLLPAFARAAVGPVFGEAAKFRLDGVGFDVGDGLGVVWRVADVAVEIFLLPERAFPAQEFIVPDALVQNYAPSVQDFQLLPTSRRGRSRARCGRTGTAGTRSQG
jgi:hypothetical protein